MRAGQSELQVHDFRDRGIVCDGPYEEARDRDKGYHREAGYMVQMCCGSVCGAVHHDVRQVRAGV